jgi:hypothetical protein
MKKVVLTKLMVAFFLAVPFLARGITVLTGPTFTPATAAPLAGLLQLTTDVNSRISIMVNDGTTNWTRDFYNFSTNHSRFSPDSNRGW